MATALPKIISPFSMLRKRPKESSRFRKQIDVFEHPGEKGGLATYHKPSDASEDPEQFASVKFHASLSDALKDTPLPSADELAVGIIPRTVGLQKGEKEYKASRAVLNSPIRVAEMLPDNIHKNFEIASDAVEHPNQRHEVCCLHPCKFIRIQSHKQKFLHICPYGNRCGLYLQSDAEHCSSYTHHAIKKQRQQGEAAACSLPSFSAAKYQANQPRISWCPRAGFRPEGGCTESTEMRYIHSDKHSEDTVILMVKGLNINWDNDDFAAFLRENAAPGCLPKQSSLIFGQAAYFQNNGTGTVHMRSYADANSLKKALHGKSFYNTPGSIVTVEYLNAILNKPDQTKIKEGWLQCDPAIPRYNQAIRDCGPYYDDAEAIFDWMKDDGHIPHVTTYCEMLRCYRDTNPPQPKKAAGMLQNMREDGINVNTAACNLIVDTWCKVGDMRRAEALVSEMESEKWLSTKQNATLTGDAPDHWLKQYLPHPNHETYTILSDGWQRAGLLHTVADQEGPFGLPGPGGALRTAVAGVGAMRAPASTILTSWARQRSGYVSTHSGCMQCGVQLQEGAETLEVEGPTVAKGRALHKWRARN